MKQWTEQSLWDVSLACSYAGDWEYGSSVGGYRRYEQEKGRTLPRFWRSCSERCCAVQCTFTVQHVIRDER